MKYVTETDMYAYLKISILYSLHGSDILDISGFRIWAFSVCLYPQLGQSQIINVAATLTRAFHVKFLNTIHIFIFFLHKLYTHNTFISVPNADGFSYIFIDIAYLFLW